jgi:transcriptional regulator with XRE-family HTH domain
MDLVRVGDKLISKLKIVDTIEEMLSMRRQGHSQAEVAKRFGIDRTFISRLENLGEVRKGKTIALVAFPVKNTDQLRQVCRNEGVEFTFIMNNRERWDFVSQKTGIELLNEVMGLIYKARQYDVVIMIGSDQRLKLFRALLNNEVIPIVIGESPITSDVYVDPDNLRSVIKSIKEEGS